MDTAKSMDHNESVSPRLPLVLLHNREYVLMLTAGVTSAIGTQMSQFALPLLALGLTHSPLWAGLLGAAQQLPYVVLSLPAGAWVDRVHRQRLLVVCDVVRGILVGSIPLAYALGMLQKPLLFGVVFGVGLCTVLFEVAELAALPHVVPPAQLARARSISEGIEAAATVLGPSLGGIIVSMGRTTVGGAVLAYLVDSLSYVLSASALRGVHRPLQLPLTPTPASFWSALREGACFLWHHPTLRTVMIVTTTVNFLQAPLSLCVILVAQQRLGLSPAQSGLLFGVAGGAAVLGAVLAGWVYGPARLRLIILVSLIVWVLSAWTIAFAADYLPLALGWALTRLVWPVYAVAVVSYRLAETPAPLQGRVISAFRTLSYGAEPVGLVIGGLSVAVTGPSVLCGIIGIGLLPCLGMLRWCLGSTSLRRTLPSA